MLLNILSSLLAKTEYSLTKIRRIFPADKDPKDGVSALVELFELTLESAKTLQNEFPSVFLTLPEARQFASKLATEPTCDLLASFLKVKYNVGSISAALSSPVFIPPPLAAGNRAYM